MTNQTRAGRLGLEPGSINTWAAPGDAPDDREISHSIAISLKRIADAICGDEHNTGIHHAILEIADRNRP